MLDPIKSECGEELDFLSTQPCVSLESQLEMAQFMESVGTLACGLVHDFNNVLTVIMGQAQIIELELQEKAAERIEKIIFASQRAARIARSLLDISHRSTSPDIVTCIAPLLRESVRLLGSAFQNRAVFSLHIRNETLSCRAGPTILHQIILNLCINAVEAMDKKERVDIFLGDCVAEDNKPMAELIVKDRGKGISPELQDKIFTPFFSTKQNGHGLGLSMVNQLVKRYGGSISLESMVGEGSTFRILLPKAETIGTTALGKLALPRGHGEIVAVMDPDREVANTMVDLLNTYGYRGVVIPGFEAWKQYLGFKGNRVDLLIAEASLLKNWPDTPVEYLHKARASTRIIIIGSGEENTRNADQAIFEGLAQAYLPKPIIAENMLPALENALR